MSVDVIIPVYRPDNGLIALFDGLGKQSIAPERIIIMNTEQKYWEAFFYEHPQYQLPKNLEVHHLSKREFDHGATRRSAMNKSSAEFALLMTQDAIPADERLIEQLLSPLLADETIAASYARQLPKEDAGEIEKYTRAFNYPETSQVKRKEDVEKLGIKAYFCSNVCAMYRKEIYTALGGFVKSAIFNEDMIFAHACIEAGYGIAYAADAQVYHSHNYTDRQQFHRNFDLGVSQAEHPEIFAQISSGAEGIRLVKATAAYLRSIGEGRQIPRLITASGSKFLGYRMGKRYQKLSHKRILKYTMNQEYWYRKWDKTN